jgi:preprotein translocase subunit SecB
MSNIKIVTQYIKNLSIEVPGAPEVFLNPQDKPNIDVAIDIDAKKLGDENYEISLTISAKATADGQDLFNCEVTYAGIFSLGEGLEGDTLEQILLIYCPNMLFPFLRRIITSTTADAGFSPLMLDPIDFATLYTRRKAAQNSEPVNDTKN